MKSDDIQAFPATTHGAEGYEVNAPQYGMTLRDYFAAATLQGLLAADPGIGDKKWRERTAVYSYAMADAMLEARQL